jgi:hypothetical protein
MTTLGDRLQSNIDREKQAAHDSAAALSLLQTEEARKEFGIVKEFFDKSREYFTQGILAGKPVAQLYRQLGGKRYSSCHDCHEEAAGVINIYQNSNTKLGPDSLLDPKKFGSLWSEFRQWAQSEGMVASWHYCWSGGGEDNWWQLRVEPQAKVLKR